jgi:hypothetical protein
MTVCDVLYARSTAEAVVPMDQEPVMH